MRQLLLILLCLLFAATASAQVRVKGYTKANGTYVAPHYRSAPNNTRSDNYSTRGNYNPYTSKRGTESPWPSFNQSTPRMYVPPVAPAYYMTWPSPSSTPFPDVARERLNALGAKLAVEDPFFEQRLKVLLPQLPSYRQRFITSGTSAENMVATIENAYWTIPATKNGASAAIAPPTLIAQYETPTSYTCEAVEEARQRLESVANDLLDCARRRDYSDDCASEVNDVQDTGDSYESAVSDASGDCY